MTDKKWEVTLKLLKKFHIQQLLIADATGLKKSVISEKMNPLKADKFSDEQKEKISKYLLSMSKNMVKSLEKL